MKLSIIIPVYNVEKYLEKCLLSVLGQSHRDFEVILINDGSSDASADICQQFAKLDHRIRYLDKKNEGLGATRNLGVELAEGEYITFLDSDDWWDEQYAERMMDTVGVADIVVCDIVYIHEDKGGNNASYISKIRIPDGVVQSVQENPDLINVARTFLWGKIFKKELFMKYNIRQPENMIEDIPITPLLVAKAGSICRMGAPLYYYRRGREGHSLTSFQALFSFVDALKALQMNFQNCNLTIRFQKALHKMYYSQVRFALRKGLSAIRKGENQSNYDELKIQLYAFLAKSWNRYPLIDGKTFATVNDAELEEGINRILIDDNLLKDNAEDVDYLVVRDKTEAMESMYKAKHVVKIVPDIVLTGEDLYWDIADKILFALER